MTLMTKPTSDEPASPISNPWPSRLAIAAILGVFGLLKFYGLHDAAWDDNIYFYLADRMGDGLVPYRDFDHAHPPLHLLTLSLAYQLTGGYSLEVSRLLPALATAITGISLYRLVYRMDRGMAVLACAVFLLSYHILRISTHLDGANLATMWLAIGLERIVRERDFQAALCLVLAGFTLFNTIPAAVGAWAVILLIDRTRGLRLAAMGLGLFVVCVAVTVAITGMPFFDQVIGYHLGKASVSDSLAATFMNTLRLSPWLVGAGILGVVALILLPSAGDGGTSAAPRARQLAEAVEARLPLHLALGGGLASLLFLATLSRVFAYYLTPLLFCMAPLAAFGLASLGRLARESVIQRDREAMTGALILGVFFCVTQAPAVSGFLKATGPVEPRSWKGSGVAAVDAIVRPLFWRDERQPDARYLAWTHYLWAEADHFEEADRLVETILERSNEGDTIFGDSLAAPLVALRSQRRLAFDMADTNYMRFERSPGTMSDTLARLDETPPRYIVLRDERGLARSHELREWMARDYNAIRTTRNASATRIHQLYQRR
jgi:hypothetical protein